MTYTVSSGMLKSTIPYHSFYCWLINMLMMLIVSAILLMLLIVSARLLMWMPYCWWCWLWVSDYWCECHNVDVVDCECQIIDVNVILLMLLIVSVRLLMWMSYCWCCWLWVSDYWCECHIVDVVVDDVDQYSSDGNRADPECLHNRQQQHELSYLDVKLRFMFRLLTRCYLLTCTLTSETALIITSLLIVIT